MLSLVDISEHQEGPCHMMPSSQGRCRHPTEHKEVREAEMKEERKEITEGKRLLERETEEDYMLPSACILEV